MVVDGAKVGMEVEGFTVEGVKVGIVDGMMDGICDCLTVGN
jgi:hypothetical protein